MITLTGSRVPAVAVDDGLSLPGGTGGVVTVSFDGRYVWSFQPARDATRDGARLTIGRPSALRPHLHGCTRLTVADHHGGQVYVDQVVVLGGEEPAEAGGCASRTPTATRSR